jgi:hypothetical protein
MPDIVLEPGRTYQVAFSRPVGLPGRVARGGVLTIATGAEIEPYRDFILTITEATDEPA